MSTSRLEALAYRMLGSVADAEDVLQEAQLRRLKLAAPPDNEEAWLTRVVTNLALDRLREQKRRRETYTGPWLPEPLPTATEGDEPEGVAELAEQLGMGLMLMLERLSPVERAVFVLREGFDLGFDDIGAMLDSTPASCRQRYRRAKAHLAGEEDRGYAGPPEVQRRLLASLLDAVAARDLPGLVSLFTEDCVAYADGGGVVSAAIIPVTAPKRIAQVTLHVVEKLAAEGEMGIHWTTLNGNPGLLISQNGRLVATVALEAAGDLIRRVYIVRNPEKLAHLALTEQRG
ncbi:MAG: sigma-70 family RNA polymerase sigma factor [Pseudomonadales bacterium]